MKNAIEEMEKSMSKESIEKSDKIYLKYKLITEVYKFSVIILGFVSFVFLSFIDWKISLCLFFILWSENVTKKL